MDSKKSKNKYRELIDLLNEWDPLDVSNTGIKDEYECFIEPMLNSLQKNPNKYELVDIINKHLEDHVGLEAKHYDTEEFADQVLNWWKSL